MQVKDYGLSMQSFNNNIMPWYFIDIITVTSVQIISDVRTMVEVEFPKFLKSANFWSDYHWKHIKRSWCLNIIYIVIRCQQSTYRETDTSGVSLDITEKLFFK